MKLQGSCHCGAVSFTVNSRAPYPYMRCYCSICRKTAGGGGYAINLQGDAETLQVEGRENISIYHARLGEEEISPAERNFCRYCGSCLWLYDSRWPELLHPFASAIDTELPAAPEHVHIMLGSNASWVEVPAGDGEQHFDEYPDRSIVEWHRERNLLEDD